MLGVSQSRSISHNIGCSPYCWAKPTDSVPSKHKTFVYLLYNVGPTSETMGLRCINVIQMFCVYWVCCTCHSSIRCSPLASHSIMAGSTALEHQETFIKTSIGYSLLLQRPSKHQMLIRRWIDIGPASQKWTNINPTLGQRFLLLAM